MRPSMPLDSLRWNPADSRHMETAPTIIFNVGMKIIYRRDILEFISNSVVKTLLMVQWVVGSILHDGQNELFLIPASAP